MRVDHTHINKKLPESLSKKLALGKYSQWATDIDEDTVVALCWFAGEIMYRSSRESFSPETFLDRHGERGAITETRPDIGLEGMYEICNGRKYSGGISEVVDRIYQGIHERSPKETD